MSLPHIPAVTRLAPLITRILGQNPGPRTLQGTNSYLLGSPHLARVLIDTTSKTGLPTYLKILKSELEQCTDICPLSAVVITHWHPDHTQAISAVLELADTLAGKDTRETVLRHRDSIGASVPVYKYTGGPELSKLGFYRGSLIEMNAGQLIPIPAENGAANSIHLRVIHTPGHSDDHVCLLLEHDGIPVALFTGDMILGHGSTTVQHLPAYVQSLYDTRQLLEEIESSTQPQGSSLVLYPAHGIEIQRPVDKVLEYLENRWSRLQKTVEFLHMQPPDRWVKEEDILQFVYAGVPPPLRIAALFNLRHSLYWIASGRDFPFRRVECSRKTLIARVPDGTGQTVDEAGFQELIRCSEAHMSNGPRPSGDAATLAVLQRDWEWKYSD